jgi:hypothetical protein
VSSRLRSSLSHARTSMPHPRAGHDPGGMHPMRHADGTPTRDGRHGWIGIMLHTSSRLAPTSTFFFSNLLREADKRRRQWRGLLDAHDATHRDFIYCCCFFFYPITDWGRPAIYRRLNIDPSRGRGCCVVFRTVMMILIIKPSSSESLPI